jgi:hypothetical protein
MPGSDQATPNEEKIRLRTRSKGRLEFRDEDKAWWLARKD